MKINRLSTIAIVGGFIILVAGCSKSTPAPAVATSTTGTTKTVKTPNGVQIKSTTSFSATPAAGNAKVGSK